MTLSRRPAYPGDCPGASDGSGTRVPRVPVSHPRPAEGGTVTAVERFEEDLVRRFLQELDAQFRQLLDAQRASWADVEEANFVPNATSLTLKAQSENEERISGILAYAGVAAGNAGLVSLGDADLPHQFLVPAGQLLNLQVNLRLKNTSTRRISSVAVNNNAPTGAVGAAGYLYLGLFGSEVPIGRRRW